jgi:hypothetical protein
MYVCGMKLCTVHTIKYLLYYRFFFIPFLLERTSFIFFFPPTVGSNKECIKQRIRVPKVVLLLRLTIAEVLVDASFFLSIRISLTHMASGFLLECRTFFVVVFLYGAKYLL